MAGTIRNIDSTIQKDVHEKIKLTAQKIAESMGATAEVSMIANAGNLHTARLVKKMLPSLEKAMEGERNENEW